MWPNQSKYSGFGRVSCFLNFLIFMVSGLLLEVILTDFGSPRSTFWGTKKQLKI